MTSSPPQISPQFIYGPNSKRTKPLWASETLRLAHLITFGCQMNDYDSGRLAERLAKWGWALTQNKEEANLIFFNTCSIREKAATRLFNHLEQLHPLKKRPDVLLAVGGCVAEQEGAALLEGTPWLDIVLGPQHLPLLPELVAYLNYYEARLLATGSGSRPAWSSENLATLNQAPESSPVEKRPLIQLSVPNEADGHLRFEAENEAYLSTESKVETEVEAELDDAHNAELNPSLLATVTIMQGCDNYCTYCVVPYVRGPELSRRDNDIIEEVKMHLAQGARDITLLGQNVNSYGQNLPASPSFPELLVKVAETGVERLRFTTSHPKDFPPELIGLFGQLKALAESLHLPVQSGSDRILQAMGRIYTCEKYLRLVDDLRTACPELALTTDIIVGFPGETENDFLATLDLIKTVAYDAMFSFKYSDRPQAKASRLPGKIPEEEKGRRLTELQKVQKEITLAKNALHVGQTLEVLVERSSKRYAGQLSGRARNFKMIHFDGPPQLIGQLVPVEITEAWGGSLRGILRKN